MNWLRFYRYAGNAANWMSTLSFVAAIACLISTFSNAALLGAVLVVIGIALDRLNSLAYDAWHRVNRERRI